MNGTTLSTPRFGRVTLSVIDDEALAAMKDRAVEDHTIVWEPGMTPGPGWDLTDETGRRYRPVAQRGTILYVLGPAAHNLHEAGTKRRSGTGAQVPGTRRPRLPRRVYREEEE